MSRLRRQAPVLVVIAAGGAAGSLARYAVSDWQAEPPGWPWATLLVNVTGCFFVGVLMTVLALLSAPHRLLRPFLGIGVLGGYTTFSTYAVDIQAMLVDGRYAAALLYLGLTPVTALLAVWLGSAGTREALSRWNRGPEGAG
ncbi:fluoride efflux transporter CrcB [Jiangella gansuensis]|uniref:fluoride efflux transporter CrcB n=1 Tax=Jiangella gansuensis TaxID=281473 RepID=UPI000A06B6DD|nr:fluoride efflux transporter CrcB [Jiangella gansuensis]